MCGRRSPAEAPNEHYGNYQRVDDGGNHLVVSAPVGVRSVLHGYVVCNGSYFLQTGAQRRQGMKTYTKIVHEGEDLGPVDWRYDFAASGWDRGGSMNPDCIPSRVEMLKQIEHGDWEATVDGGWPRCGWGKVLAVAMYDGWPHWKPTPSFLLSSWAGASWHSWDSLTDVRASQPSGGAALDSNRSVIEDALRDAYNEGMQA